MLGYTEPYAQMQALISVVEALATAGDHDRAEQLARTVTEPSCRHGATSTLST